MTSLLRSTRGVTLVELLVSMFTASVIMGAVGVTYVNTTQHYVRNREMAQTQMRSRLSIDFVSQEIRNAGYIVNWDPVPASPSIAVNAPIAGAVPDPGTDSITLRYAVGPWTGAQSATVVTTLTATANPNAPTVTVATVNVDGNVANGNEIAVGTLIVLYTPPTTANVRRVTNVNGNQLTLSSNTGAVTFPAGSVVAVVRETSFWVQGGHLMTSTAGGPQRLATNVEDLQFALLDSTGNVVGVVDNTLRAVRLSLTGRSVRTLRDRTATVPPSLEDHDRSAEAADRFLRQVQQTTAYLRNFGSLAL